MAGLGFRALALAAAVALEEVVAAAAAGASAGCSTVEADIDYIAGISYNLLPNIFNVSACCVACTVDHNCKAWVWGLQLPTDQHNSMCYLKTSAPPPALKMRSPGTYSGLPGSRGHPTAAPTTAAPTVLASTTAAPTTAAPTTAAPTIAAPITLAPTTAAPATAAPTTEAPTAKARATVAPTTAAATTAAPTTAAATTAAPTMALATIAPIALPGWVPAAALVTAAPSAMAAPSTTAANSTEALPGWAPVERAAPGGAAHRAAARSSTTAAPTTVAPTTAAPTTTTPTTAKPTTTAPTTTIAVPSTTVAPTTAAPTTTTPTTLAPTTTTRTPTTVAPTTEAPAARTRGRSQAAKSEARGQCQTVEHDMDYLAGFEVSRKYGVEAAADCCDACLRTEKCKSWTWGLEKVSDEKPSVCYMKSAAPQGWQKHPTPGVGLVSGLPDRKTTVMSTQAPKAPKETKAPAKKEKKKVYGNIPENDQCGGRQWTGSGRCSFGLVCHYMNEWYSQCRKDPSAQFDVAGGASDLSSTILCWSVVTPGTFEPGVMVLQWKLHAGLFACDDYTIISNTTAAQLFPDPVMASKVRVTVIPMQLYAPMGRGPHGNFHAMNSPVFIEAWRRLIADGLYKKYDWTLKLDVDAVIAPVRVKALLWNKQRQGDHFAPMYLLNAGIDAAGNYLHGPVEALSKAAVDAYAQGADRCKTQVDYSHEGEDWYLNACLQLLQVPGVQEMQLLQDAYMWGQKEVDCNSPQGVFHPAKTVDRWMQCVRQIGQDAIKPLPEDPSEEAELVMKFDSPRAVAAPLGGFVARQWVVFSALLAVSLVLLAAGLAVLHRRGRLLRRLELGSRPPSSDYRSISLGVKEIAPLLD